MRSAGVEVPRRMLNDRYTVRHSGNLVMLEVTDQGLRRPVKVARLYQNYANATPKELIDPRLLWISEDRFVLTGFESIRNEAGQRVDVAQSWLCTLDLSAAAISEARAERKPSPRRGARELE